MCINCGLTPEQISEGTRLAIGVVNALGHLDLDGLTVLLGPDVDPGCLRYALQILAGMTVGECLRRSFVNGTSTTVEVERLVAGMSEFAHVIDPMRGRRG